MQQWCCSSLVTACQRLPQLQPQRLLPLNSMAPKQVHSHHYSAWTGNLCQTASAASKQRTNRHVQSRWRETDRFVGQLLHILQRQVKQQCRGHSIVSTRSLLHSVPFRSLAYSIQNATQNGASPTSRLKASMSQRGWRHSTASMAAKHSGVNDLPPQSTVLMVNMHSHHTAEGVTLTLSSKPCRHTSASTIGSAACTVAMQYAEAWCKIEYSDTMQYHCSSVKCSGIMS